MNGPQLVEADIGPKEMASRFDQCGPKLGQRFKTH
jgi:hypothetical protein